jgi:hypothetical protein
MGAGVGVGIDALIRGRRVIYSAAPTAKTVRLSPILGHDRKGAFVAIGF